MGTVTTLSSFGRCPAQHRSRYTQLHPAPGLTVDLRTRSVSLDGEAVSLTPREFSLLRVLASEPQRLFTKEELLVEVRGPGSIREARVLDATASRLRRKLAGRVVVNVWGVGYRLADDGPVAA